MFTMEKTHQTSDQREAYIQRAKQGRVYAGNIMFNSLKNYWKVLAMDKQRKFKFKVK